MRQYANSAALPKVQSDGRALAVEEERNASTPSDHDARASPRVSQDDRRPRAENATRACFEQSPTYDVRDLRRLIALGSFDRECHAELRIGIDLCEGVRRELPSERDTGLTSRLGPLRERVRRNAGHQGER